ncbi:MAG: dihydroxyacetone kinase subunit L [Alphaproteobacteria bacterium]|jgi:dihydroxyacetone kinase-like protein|nr:dihydroxyacetone kinase subunit L [Alphaproteobacteria bacterium]
MQVSTTQGIIATITKNLETHKDELDGLDRDIGDGDHGSNIVRGFEAVLEDSKTWEGLTLAAIMKKIGMTLLAKVGGASGVLYASACLKISPALNKETLSTADFLNAINIAMLEIATKGKSAVGNKTMLDAMDGFSTALANKMQNSDNFLEILADGVAGAKEGAERTKDMVAKSGRASYLGERSIGHVDAGATSFCIIVGSILEYLENK